MLGILTLGLNISIYGSVYMTSVGLQTVYPSSRFVCVGETKRWAAFLTSRVISRADDVCLHSGSHSVVSLSFFFSLAHFFPK